MDDPGRINYYKFVDSKYKLVHIISQRAKQLLKGADPLVETDSKKPTTIALEEFVQGKLKWQTPEDNPEANKDNETEE